MTDCLVPVDDKAPSMLTAADESFISRFEECSLPENEWTHLAHIRVAWILLNRNRADEALQKMRSGILRYNTEVLNRRKKYHETVTTAFARIVADRMREGELWEDFAKRIDDLLSVESPILLQYYSQDRLFSDEARAQFVEPDVKDIPKLPGNCQ